MDKKKLLISLLALCTCSPFLGRGFGGEASAQEVYTLKSCLEKGLQNNYSLRIIHNEEQVSKNNATPGNAGYLPTIDFSAGYKGTVDFISG